MKREYEVKFNRWDIREYEDSASLKDDIWETSVYLEYNRDWIIDNINEESGFSYGSYSYTAAEILDRFGDLDDILDSEAQYYIDDIRGSYDDMIDEMSEGDTVSIDELGIEVECTKVIPENEEEAEELEKELPRTVEDELLELIA